MARFVCTTPDTTDVNQSCSSICVQAFHTSHLCAALEQVRTQQDPEAVHGLNILSCKQTHCCCMTGHDRYSSAASHTNAHSLQGRVVYANCHHTPTVQGTRIRPRLWLVGQAHIVTQVTRGNMRGMRSTSIDTVPPCSESLLPKLVLSNCCCFRQQQVEVAVPQTPPKHPSRG